MNSAWRLNGDMMIAELAFDGWALVEVLVAFDGPAIAIWTDEKKALYFGVAADEADGVVRWLLAPVDDIELDAMYLGALSVRDAVCKPQLLVIDVESSMRIIRGWVSTPDSLDDEVLPERRALLPSAVRNARKKNVEKDVRAVRIAKVGASGHELEFLDLATILSAQQRLWTASAQILDDAGGKAKGTVKRAIARKSVLLAAAAHSGTPTPSKKWRSRSAVWSSPRTTHNSYRQF